MGLNILNIGIRSQIVNTVLVKKIFCGGGFTDYKGVTANRIIKLNEDGSKDTSFDNSTGFDSTVNKIAFDSTGRIYVGGAFTDYKGVTANRIIRLNADGSKDTGFDNSTGFNGIVNSIKVDIADKIYVVGAFTEYKGVAANRIIKLNDDGSKDTSFDNSTGFNNTVDAVDIDSNGKIYASGSFTSYKATTANRIIRLETDGSKDTGFDNSTGFNNPAYYLIVGTDDQPVVAGDFTAYKGATNNRIIKLNTDGSKDTGFNNSTGFNSGVRSLTMDYSTNQPYVGGIFTTYKGGAASGIIKLNTDGSKDTSFNYGTGFTGPVAVRGLGYSDNLWATGNSVNYQGVAFNNIIRINEDGSKNTSFDNSTGFNSQLACFAFIEE